MAATTTVPGRTPIRPVRPVGALARLRAGFHDGVILARRNLRHVQRNPERLLDVTVQPIMFTVLFVYVFGGAIHVPGGGEYRDYLMAGIFVQTLAFNSFGTSLGLAKDRDEGFVDRLLALPSARASLLVGRALADLAQACLALSVLTATALVVGWRPDAGLFHVVGAYAMLLLFVFAMIWVGVLIGCIASSPEAVMGIGFILIFPLTFVANTFVPTSGMPVVVRTIAEWNPISSIVAATRELMGNAPGGPGSVAWPLHHPIPVAIGWCAVLLAVFVPLALWQYRRVTRT